MRNSSFLIIFIASMFPFVSGCGEQLPPGMPRPHPVTIQIVSEGNPVEGASVMFFPEDQDSRWASGGTTDSAGNVQIRTLGRFNGAPAGVYWMSISKTDMVEVPGRNPENPNFAYYSLIDPKFNNMAEPAVTVEVKPGRNVFVQEVGPLVRIRQQHGN